MSRNIRDIYRSAVETRNKYLQLATEKTPDLSASKMSVMNMITYTMSSLIYTFENMFDVFLADASRILEKRTVGTPEYYVFMATQYSPGCTVVVNDDATGLDVIDNGNAKLIPYASFETVTSNNGIVLKVCKDVDGAVTPLTSSELSAFTDYIKKIRFVGAPVVIRSVPADLLTPKIRVVYNESLVSAEDALANIKTAIDNYAKSLEYDSNVYQSAIIDAIQEAYGIADVPSTLSDGTPGRFLIQKNDYSKPGGYSEQKEITGWYKPYSGYLTTLLNGSTTINTNNIELQSRMEYLSSKNQ